jgi:hypothetical protein
MLEMWQRPGYLRKLAVKVLFQMFVTDRQSGTMFWLISSYDNSTNLKLSEKMRTSFIPEPINRIMINAL